MAWQLSVAYLEFGFDGPGWYVLDDGNPIWGAFDTKQDAELERKDVQRHRIGPAVRLNGHSVWIVDAMHEDENEMPPPLWRRGFLVMVDDEDTGPYHQTIAAAQEYMRGTSLTTSASTRNAGPTLHQSGFRFLHRDQPKSHRQ